MAEPGISIGQRISALLFAAAITLFQVGEILDNGIDDQWWVAGFLAAAGLTWAALRRNPAAKQPPDAR